MYKSTLLAAALFISGFCSAAPDNDQVLKAAQNDLSRFLALIPAGRETLYGFSSTDNMQNCTLGKPYQIYTLSMEFFKGNYVAGKNYAVPVNEWRVPVVLNGTSRTLLTVDKKQENYVAVDMSGAALSQELQQAGAKATTGDDLYIFRVYQLSADFFVDAKTSSIADATFIPLASAIMSMPTLKNKPSYTLNEIIEIIKNRIDQQPKN